MIDTIPVTRAFEKMGAKIVVSNDDGSRWRRSFSSPTIDVREVEGKETFLLGLPVEDDKIQLQVLDVKPGMKHLLLLVKTEGEIRGRAEVEKYLCGHDERHWFVSSVKGKNVMDALQGLKPAEVQRHEKIRGVKRARKHKHHNEAWTRQGEWFFIPTPDFNPEVSKAIVVKNEPISRGRGSKPHMCEELARIGGTTVYSDGSSILSVAEYNKLLSEGSSRIRRFVQRTVDAGVYVRGKIRHPDHKTVEFRVWHRVQLNGEIVSSNVRFLD